jgi:hypothetical protein
VPHKNEHYTFKPNKKITKVEVFIIRAEDILFQINFYSGQERLVGVFLDDDYVKKDARRVELFEIADDEQLIGAQLYHGKLFREDCFQGVTFLKCKITK